MAIGRGLRASALGGLAALLSVTHGRPARAATDPHPVPGVPWLLAQLIPSPETIHAQGTFRSGLRWQITPLLVSYGVRPGLLRYRTLVAEPLVRHSGSTELHVSPEWISAASNAVGVRLGVRSYFPLSENGEYLSWSIGTSYLRVGSERSAVFELGLHTLFGVLGARLSYAPRLFGGSWIGSLEVRYF
jgi:hypothetical protein